MLKFGFARQDITPERGVPLAGYFEPRPNTGELDFLYVRAALFACGDTVTGIVSFDLLHLPRAVVTQITDMLKKAGLRFADNLLFAATHTHTGPYTDALFDGPVDRNYIDSLVGRAAAAVCNAYADLAEAELYAGKSECTTLAFNRRFWMKDGSVLTNPGKLNPDIVRPEGGIDPEIPFLIVRQAGMDRLIVANIGNHADTIGGDLVSADWPGRMERAIQKHYGYDIPVIMLLGCQGNINHINVESPVNQSSYAEACRIGKGYAEAVVQMLYSAEKIEVGRIEVDSEEFEAPVYHVTDAEYEEARKLLAESEAASATSFPDMTGKEHAFGSLSVKRLFAKCVLANRDDPLPGKRIERMISIKFGDAVGIVSLPAEPFMEIGIAIKKTSRFPYTMVAALGMGTVGYVAMPENYERGGGYETRPSRTSPAHDLAFKFISLGTELLKR